ncbi:MAG TPA: metallophosphoesterase [Kofleriaceae bacterium]|nr:metallophosphoesterase [Kofleriaceae bacterium]
MLVTAACGSSATGVGDDGDDDSPPADGNGGGGDGSGSNPDAPPGPRPVRFVAFGDTGEGSPTQAQVSAVAKTVCDAAGGCDFALLLGDNIYDTGATSVNDMQFQTKFEQPYANFSIPFYAVLGNHDYGGNIIGIDVGGLGNEWDKGPNEVAYTNVSSKWEMPATHYTFSYENVGFIALDTNSILWSNTQHGDQTPWYTTAQLEIMDKQWKFLLGHHPYRSNGQHGNAGTYDAPEIFGIPIPFSLPIQGGADLKSWFDTHVCGTVDIYMSGHDHSRQWLNEPTALCGTEMIVSGAGAKVTSLVASRGNQAYYEDATTEGFLFVEIVGKRMTGRFYDKTGAMNFERTIMKP